MPTLYRFVLGALVALTLAPVASQAQDVKIGYLDPELLITLMPEARDIQAQLEERFEADEQELVAMQQTLAERLQDYEQNAAVLNDEARQQREQELRTLQQELQQQQLQKRQALQQQQVELIQPLYDKIQAAIDEVASAQELTLVLSVQANSAAVVLYASQNAIDLTQPVAERLGISLTTGAGGQ
ncbi:MAG: OmpH family outer membrane protein [Bacteroidota bacterium]